MHWYQAQIWNGARWTRHGVTICSRAQAEQDIRAFQVQRPDLKDTRIITVQPPLRDTGPIVT